MFTSSIRLKFALGGITYYACSGRQRNVLKSVHVQSCCFAHKIVVVAPTSLLTVNDEHGGSNTKNA